MGGWAAKLGFFPNAVLSSWTNQIRPGPAWSTPAGSSNAMRKLAQASKQGHRHLGGGLGRCRCLSALKHAWRQSALLEPSSSRMRIAWQRPIGCTVRLFACLPVCPRSFYYGPGEPAAWFSPFRRRRCRCSTEAPLRLSPGRAKLT